jgi:putative peptide zinc metalloprotease protein
MRSNKYIGYLLQKHLLKIEDLQSPVTAKGEAPWFLLYSLASFAYRVFIMIRIAIFVAGRFFIIGIALALWGVVGMLIMPLFKVFKFLFADPSVQRKRTRAFTVTGISIFLLVLSIFIIPFPSFTVSEGVLWAPDNSWLYTGTEGFVKKIVAVPGGEVKKGEPLIICENPDLVADKKELESSLKEFEVRLRLAETRDRTEVKILQDEIWRIRSELKDLLDDLDGLTIRSPSDGVFILPESENLYGHYIRRGSHLGYVVDFDKVTARIVVNQKDVDRIRTNTKNVEAKQVGVSGETYSARIKREIPAASTELPSVALSLEGGGELALDPTEREKVKAFETLFHFEVIIDSPRFSTIGERVFIRFSHGSEPLFYRIFRSIRRTLLSKFSV